MADEAQGSPSLLAAVERTRATAKWMLVTLAGAAGAILVGAKITDLAKVDDLGSVIAAILGVGLAGGGLALAIFAVARVLAPAQPLNKENAVVSAFRDPRVLAIVEEDRTLLSGFATSVEELETKLAQALETLRAAQEAVAVDDSDENQRALRGAQLRVQGIQPVAQYLRDLAIHEEVRSRFDSAVRALGLSTAGVIAGSALFNIAAG